LLHPNQVSYQIIGCALRIHRDLGPGLFESVYHRILHRQLTKAGLSVESNKELSFAYDEDWFERGLRTDLIVEKCVVVEIKSAEAIADVHLKQLLTYLKLTHCKVGLLLNFGAANMHKGIKRLVNGL
jgi:GxxExxY protein